MENGLIVIALLAQFDEIFAGFRHHVALQFEVQRAHGRHQSHVALFFNPPVPDRVIVQNRRLLDRPRVHRGRRDPGGDHARRIICRINLPKIQYININTYYLNLMDPAQKSSGYLLSPPSAPDPLYLQGDNLLPIGPKSLAFPNSSISNLRNILDRFSTFSLLLLLRRAFGLFSRSNTVEIQK